MKKTILVGILLVVVSGLLVYTLYLNSQADKKYITYANKNTLAPEIKTGPDVKNISYIVDGQIFTLQDGKGEITAGSDPAFRVNLAMFSEPVYGDLNGDGKQDAAVLLVNDSSGTGTFYYVVLAIKNSEGDYRATNVLLLGDRIAPQTVEIHNGQAVYNYAVRKPYEPMTAQPSVGKSFFVQYNKEDNSISERIITATMTEAEAKVIAEQTCIKGGESLAPGSYNAGTKTWWFDANLNATREGCNPACVVNETTKTAEINWRCTGLLKPGTACPQDAKLCPDGSYVSRTGPNCEFAVCPK